MKKKIALIATIMVCISIVLALYLVNVNAAITSNQTGTHDGFYYSFWNQGGGSVE
jgi:endo-1,4-beta-xylanase